MPIDILSSLTVRDLRYALAVAERGGFSRAAPVCGVSQPTLSVQISKLEQLLGCQLFERSGRRFAVTKEGNEVLAYARRIVAESEAMVQAARKAEVGFAGEVRIGSIPTIGPYYWPLALPVIRRRFPDLQIGLTEGKTREMVEMLSHGTLDLAVMSSPVRASGLAEIPLFDEDFLLIAPSGDPVLAPARMTVQGLDPAKMVLLEEGHCMRDQMLEICSRGKGGAAVQAVGLETLRHLVSAGRGYSLMPRMAVGEHSGGLVEYREIDGKRPIRRISLYCRSMSPSLRIAKEMARVLRRAKPKGAKSVSTA